MMEEPLRYIIRWLSSWKTPRQASLAAMLARIDRLRVIDGGMVGNKAEGDRVLLDVTDAASIASLRECLAIVDTDDMLHCLCSGDPTLELFRGKRRVATIGLHHGQSIRWGKWWGDAELRDGARLRQWLAERGVTGPAEKVEESLRSQREREAELERRRLNTPPCLLPYWDELMSIEFFASSAPEFAVLRRALADTYPDPRAQATTLLRWLGSAGRRGGEPEFYELIAEMLLMRYPLTVLLGALEAAPHDETLLAGAVRLFNGGCFRHQRAADRAALPAEWQKRLLEYALGPG